MKLITIDLPSLSVYLKVLLSSIDNTLMIMCVSKKTDNKGRLIDMSSVNYNFIACICSWTYDSNYI